MDFGEDKYVRLFGRPKPSSTTKNEIDKFDLMKNDKRIIVPDGALDGRSTGKDEEESHLIPKPPVNSKS
jgi:hypothetical protein